VFSQKWSDNNELEIVGHNLFEMNALSAGGAAPSGWLTPAF